METPTELAAAAKAESDITIAEREYEDDDESVVVVDFGPAGDPSVDVVGDAAIVLVDDEQFEFAVPSDAEEVAVNGGVLTIRG